MFELIQIDLTRVRRMVELADDPFLLYLVDILTVEVKARADRLSLQTLDPPPPQPVNLAFAY
jgi:hypothetical protein